MEENQREMTTSQQRLEEYLSDPNNRRAYIINEIQKEHDEEMRILNEINTM
jgi:1,2-phenylacetyl-CoA epoxidase PaaB subunit